MAAPTVDQARRAEGVLTLCLDAGKGNVLSLAAMRALGAALDDAAGDPSLRAVVLTTAGRNFSFGAAVEEHRADQAAAMLAGFHGLIRALATFPVPLVALVQGRCLGGAFEVALACHIVLASADARFGCPEIKLGVFPPVLAALGDLRLGGALAERLLLSGDELGAEEAARAGFVAALVEGGEGALAAAEAWAGARFGGLSGYALRQATWATRRGAQWAERLGPTLDALERGYLERVVQSHDGNEGIDAFLARRPPQWTHR
jgi:cyclohexa-1,5-dienecarbonyl-CoA hydratase